MKFLILILILLENLNANEFKKERTIYYSPLSYTVNKIEKEKKHKIKINTQLINTKLESLKRFNIENSHSKNWKFKIDPYTSVISSLAGDRTKKKYEGNIHNAAYNFINDNQSFLEINLQNLKKITESSFLNTSHIYYIQTYKGLDIEFSYVKIHRNQNNEITQYLARYYKNINLPNTIPQISIEKALEEINKERYGFKISTWSVVVFPDDLNETFYLAYKIKGYGGDGFKNGNWVYYIDAINGNILFKYDTRQYACQTFQETTGTVKAYVYEISPIPDAPPDSNWTDPVLLPVKDIYVFAESYQSSATTKINGEYCIDHDISETGAKVFLTTLGPYFSVFDYSGTNVFYTNGNYQIKSVATPLSINSYNPNSILTYSITPSINTGSGSLAFVSPFFSNFNIGDIDQAGNSNDSDVVFITDNSDNIISAFTGNNKTNFIAGYIPSNSYKLKLVSDSSGNGSFNLSYSSYIVITNPTPKNNQTGSFNISLSPAINTFYHLTAIRDFMMKFNTKCLSNCIDLNRRIPVGVNVYSGYVPLYNAFYDLEKDMIYVGRGPVQGDKNFAWDGTVIRHEYIHLVMNRIYPIIYFGEFGAITEALSDYFALSSFWDEGKTISKVGNFLGIGEGASRDISSVNKKMPIDWTGEVHEDGQILSAVLYKLANNPLYSLGIFTSGGFSGLKKADVYAFGAMFYFPDSFEGFMEAMIDLCKNIEGSGCEENKIRSAFQSHGIISDYIIQDTYEPNNGPSYAVDISTKYLISGYIDYPGDEDYYVLSLNKGMLHLKLELPKSQYGLYNAYAIFLFDNYGTPLAYQMPPTNSNLCYPSYDPDYSNSCFTRSSTNEFYYYISTPGIYYVSVTGGIDFDFTLGPDYNRIAPYILSHDGKINSSVNIKKLVAAVDADEFEFEIEIPKFYYMNSYINEESWKNGNIFEFCEKECVDIIDFKNNILSKDYIQITDSNGNSGSLANYYSINSYGNPTIKGKIKFTSYGGKTFSQNYPYAGTVYFKFYVKNHMFEVGNKNDNYITIALSSNINLTGDKNELVTYNNIITQSNSEVLINLESKSYSNITVKVFTPTGNLVKKIYEGPISGKMSLSWDGTDENGKKLPPGIYYIKTEGAVNKVEKIGIVR